MERDNYKRDFSAQRELDIFGSKKTPKFLMKKRGLDNTVFEIQLNEYTTF